MKFLSAVLVLLPIAPVCHAQEPACLPPVQIYFSPKGGCTEAIVKEINTAKKTILLQAYSFTSAPIAKAIVDAHKRGVDVRVLLDKSQRTEKYSSADFVQHAGIAVWIDAKHAIAHNKIIILDDETTITGSFNFTKNAEENNAENLLIIRDKAIAEKYIENWNSHAAHSEKYEAKEKGYSETQHANPAGNYIASKNSQIFHKVGCKSAAKISVKNVVNYTSRDEAVTAGKKPCESCNP